MSAHVVLVYTLRAQSLKRISMGQLYLEQVFLSTAEQVSTVAND